MTSPLLERQGRWILAVRVTPKASQSGITGLHTAADGLVSLSVKVTAPPDKGKANKAVAEVLARALGFPKTGFELIRGETDRNKLFVFSGDANELAARLALLLKEPDSKRGFHGKDH